jgi:hypothetical protein
MNKTAAHVFLIPIEVNINTTATVEVHKWGEEWQIQSIDMPMPDLNTMDEMVEYLDQHVDLREEINEYIRQETK